MAMTPQQLTRLEKLEQFVQRLTLGSHIAKAASEGGKILGNPHLLEQGEQTLAKATVQNATAQGESVLAKAVESFKDADALLSYADTITDDPTVVGIISGHLAVGDFASARTTILEIQQRGTVAKAAENIGDVLGAAEDNLATFDAHRTVSELTARFGSIEQTLSSIEKRLAQVETRPQPAAPVPLENDSTIAKAAGKKRRLTPAQEKDELLHKIDAYVSSPTHVGYLTSQLESGQLDQVRQAVAEAERAHNAERIKQERKTWR